MKKLTLLLSLLFVAGLAFSQNNLSEVYQDGAYNIATVKQIGVDNVAYLDMLGDYNTIWQCQTGYDNYEYFVIEHGNFNSTFQGVYWVPWHYQTFGVCKFFVCQLWDPSNTQHQFGHFNRAYVDIVKSDYNKVSQTQGWKYHFPVVGNNNEARITIKKWSDFNKVMQAQLLDNNYASTFIYDKSDHNTVLQYQFGCGNESAVEIIGSSDFNKVGIVQGCGFNLSFYNENFVGIYGNSDKNEIIINQFDHSNYAEVIIEGYSDYNKVAIHQENPWWFSLGSAAFVHMYENANFNEMSICQWDGGGHYAEIEIKQGDWNKIYDGVFFGVPCVYWHPCWGPKVYTEIFWDDIQFNVIRQEGFHNKADIRIKQFGTGPDEQADRNLVSIYQYGWWTSFNYASIWIFNSSDNRAAIAQEGYKNNAWLDILWNSNENIAGISQHTDHNFAYIKIENGSDRNQANIVQGDSWYNDGYNDAYIFMNNHDEGIAIINQFWRRNFAQITQEYGVGNWATIFQKSYKSIAYIYETGDYNFASICQHYFGFHYANIYINGNHNGFNNAIEGTSPYFKPSNPGYHCGYIFKVENWVCFDPTNMIRQEGKCQVATMTIVGDWNRSSILQRGYCCGCGGCCVNNEAYLTIYGSGNITAQYQD
ncbi:MAG: hypothetical protein U9R60_16880, partial [Bacteroidota bacterium]|nr:hypothetical protein [Bacteroidota bacterium]